MKDIDQLCQEIALLGPGRRLIALAGPPGVGKSRLAARLAEQIEGAALVPMDGFHLDNHLLDRAGIRHLKGAPQSFDAAGFLALIRRLKVEGEVIYPLFDRSRDLSIAGAGRVEADCQTVIIEGNYLLLDQPIWRELAPLWDLSLRLEAPIEILRERLMRRWDELGCSAEEIVLHLKNDLDNAACVTTQSLPATRVIRTWDERP